jgi:hypothetical protein
MLGTAVDRGNGHSIFSFKLMIGDTTYYMPPFADLPLPLSRWSLTLTEVCRYHTFVRSFCRELKTIFVFSINCFFLICLRWAGPDPTSHFPPYLIFVCKFSRHEDNLSVLRPGSINSATNFFHLV